MFFDEFDVTDGAEDSSAEAYRPPKLSDELVPDIFSEKSSLASVVGPVTSRLFLGECDRILWYILVFCVRYNPLN